MKILLDTNFLMLPAQFGVDIFEYLDCYEIITLSSCVDELKRIAKKRGKDAAAAKVALKLIKENNVKAVRTKEKADKAILNYAANEKCAVGTNDKNLIARLKKHGIKIIRLRQKKYLVEE